MDWISRAALSGVEMGWVIGFLYYKPLFVFLVTKANIRRPLMSMTDFIGALNLLPLM
jgi:hypothetical protein